MSRHRHFCRRQFEAPAHLLAILVATLVFPAAAALGVCTEDLYEGGDTCHSAPTIRDGAIQPREFCDNAVDWAVFNACAGRIYVLGTANLGTSADTVLELYAPDCASLVASNDNAGGGGPASRIVWSAPSSGLYHVKIRQADGSSGLDRGYELRLTGDTSSCDTYSRTYALPATATDALGTATSDGGVLIVYNGLSVAGRGTEPVLLKLNASGTLDWRARLGTTSSESALRPVQTADGGFVVVGQSGIQGGFHFSIVKLNALGQIEWQRAHQLGLDDGGPPGLTDLQAMPDGGVVLAGRRATGFAPIHDAFVLRFDQAGALMWSRQYDGTPPPDQSESDDNALAFRPTPDGGLVLLGANLIGSSVTDTWLTRLTPAGDVAWAKSLGFSEGGGSLAITNDGGVAYALEFFNFLVIGKLDGSGNGLWSLSVASNALPRGLAASSDGGVAVAFTAPLSGDTDGYLVRFDGAGNPLWQKRYGQMGPTEDMSVLEPFPDGGFRLAGWRSGASPQMFVIKTDAGGQVLSCAPWQNATLAFAAGGQPGFPKTLVVTPRPPLDDTWIVQTGTAQAVTRVDECKCGMPPAYAGTLRVRMITGAPQVYWSPNSYRYDVVTGRLSALEATGGDFTAALNASAGPVCLAQDTTSTQVNDASAIPTPGDGAFYVLRSVDPVCLLGGSYDSLAPGQVSGRDAEIRAAPGACP